MFHIAFMLRPVSMASRFDRHVCLFCYILLTAQLHRLHLTNCTFPLLCILEKNT